MGPAFDWNGWIAPRGRAPPVGTPKDPDRRGRRSKDAERHDDADRQPIADARRSTQRHRPPTQDRSGARITQGKGHVLSGKGRSAMSKKGNGPPRNRGGPRDRQAPTSVPG